MEIKKGDIFVSLEEIPGSRDMGQIILCLENSFDRIWYKDKNSYKVNSPSLSGWRKAELHEIVAFNNGITNIKNIHPVNTVINNYQII